jgi:hypothetical protein
MYGTDDIVGAYCTLITPYKGYTEGTITGECGNCIVVTLTNGKELTVYRSDVILL